MADIDWPAFASDVCRALDCAGLSLRGAVARWPGTNLALWSRARRGRQPLSAENYLTVCRLLRISPWRHWRPADATAPPRPVRPARPTMRSIAKALRNQGVSVTVSRETEALSCSRD